MEVYKSCCRHQGVPRWRPQAECTSYSRSPLFQSNNRTSRTRILADLEPRRGPPTSQYQQWQRSSYDAPPRPSGGMSQPPPPPPPQDQRDGEGGGLNALSKALIAAAFVTGLGAGVFFDSEITLQPTNVASTELIDRKTPNSELCMAYGYSAMVFDQRLFVSFNPFNVYVTQPEVKPGCVLRQSNYSLLEKRELVSAKQVDTCKRSMNTFAFVGDLKDNPQISCVYHSEDAENQYLYNPKKQPGLLQPGEEELPADIYSVP